MKMAAIAAPYGKHSIPTRTPSASPGSPLHADGDCPGLVSRRLSGVLGVQRAVPQEGWQLPRLMPENSRHGGPAVVGESGGKRPVD